MSRQNLQPITNEILIADASVLDLNVLLNGINPNIEVKLIQEGEDGIGQILKAIADPGLKTLHILAHGAPGQINLGGRTITATDFRCRFDGAAERNLDIAFWSCHAGAGDAGQSFVQAVAETTGARVVAANSLVGNAGKGGSWLLAGTVAPFSANAQKAFDGVLAIITGTAANLAAGIGWKAGDAVIINNGAGNNNTATIAQLNLIRLGTNAGGAPASILAATVTDFAVNANELNLLDAITINNVVATAATSLTGTAAQIAIAISAATINTAANVSTTVTAGSVAATDLNTIHANTTALVDATAVTGITGLAADIATAMDSAGINKAANPAVTVSAGIATAANLNIIDAATTAVVVATAVTGITGLAADIATAMGSVGITKATNLAMTVSAGIATAANLNTIDAKTTAVVNALAVTKVTGTAAQIATALNSAGINKLASIDVTIDAGTTAAANLTIIDGNTTAVIDAKAITFITGTAAQILVVYASSKITLPLNAAVTLSGTVSVADLNSIDAHTTGVITATVLDHDVNTLLTLTGTGNAYAITVNDLTTDAANLNTLDGKTTVNVVATAVTSLTGTATNVATAISATTINTAVNVGVKVDTGIVTAANLTTIDANTTAVVDAVAVTKVTGTAAQIALALNSAGINKSASIEVTIDAGTATAANLTSIDANTSTSINAKAIALITGMAAEVQEVYASTGITLLPNVAITLSGTVSVTALNNIDVLTTGVITATVLEHDVTTLLTLTGTGNAYTITVTDPSTDAANLNTLDGKTKVNVVATAITTLTGSAADIATAISARTINTAAAVGVTVDAGIVTAANLTTIDANTTAVVDASAVATITGSALQIAAALNAPGISKSASIAVTIDSGTATAANLTSIDGKTTATIDTTAVTLIIGTAAQVKVVCAANEIALSADFGVTLLGTGATAADLTSIDSKTTAVIDAKALTLITGTANQVTEVYASAGITLTDSVAVRLSGTVSVADLNSIAVHTTGVVTATVLEHDVTALLNLTGTVNAYAIKVTNLTTNSADLNTLDGITTVNINATEVKMFTGSAADIATAISATTINTAVNLGVTVDGGAAAATDLVVIDANTGAVINATAVTEITGDVLDIQDAISTLNISYTDGYAVTVTNPATVADLNTISLYASGVITADVTEGDMATLLTIIHNPNAVESNNLSFTITDDTVAAAGLLKLASETTVNINATAVDTFTGSAADLASVMNSGVIDYVVGLHVTVDSGTADAADLNTIQSYMGISVVDAHQVAELIGTLADIETAIASTGINFAPVDDPTALPGYAITVADTDSVTVVDLNLFAAATSGVISANVSTNDMATLLTFTPADPNVPNNLAFTVTGDTVAASDLLTLASETTLNIDATSVSTFTGTAADLASAVSSGVIDYVIFLSATVDAGTADAADLNTIDNSLFLGTVDARAVTEITGFLADIETVVTSDGIAFGTGYAVTVSDFAAVADLNIIAAATEGVITASVSNGDMTSLLTLNGTNHDYSISITDLSVNAGDLLTLDAKTIEAIDATNVYTFTGSAADIASVLTLDTINHLTVGVISIVDAGTASATDLFTIDDSSILTVDATAVTTISGTVADIQNDISSDGLSFSSTYDVNIIDTGDLGTLSAFTTNGSLTVGNSSNNGITLNLGASGFATIILDGSGNDRITASAVVSETLILGAAQNGGTIIKGLTFGDTVNIDGAGAITALAGSNLGAADNVVSTGQWAFDDFNTLTYFNTVHNQAETITLIGVTTVSLVAGGDAFAIG
jgi:hypothetical protein